MPGAGRRVGCVGVRGCAASNRRDTLVIPKIGVNDRLLGEWRSAKKVHKKRGPKDAIDITTAGSSTTTATLPPASNASVIAVPALPALRAASEGGPKAAA